MGYIYKITNDINDKVYVGKTLSTIEERWKVHCQDAKRKRVGEVRPLYRAMNKYGAEHFKIEMIGEYENEILSDMEVYWIDYYHGFTDGYNATKGGDGKQLYNYETIKDELFNCPYPIIVAKKFNCSADIVRYIAKINNIQMKNYFVDSQKKKVNCYDKHTGKYITTFESFHEAARWCANGEKVLGRKFEAHICEAANPNSNRKTAYGYIWKVVYETNGFILDS